MKNKYIRYVPVWLFIGLFWQFISLSSIYAQSPYSVLTDMQKLDIRYPIIQTQNGMPITQVRLGNNVINEVDGWGPWTDITDSNGTPIVGGLLVGTATAKNWSLPVEGADNETIVCIQLKDANGDETVWNSNCIKVYWDMTGPTIETETINEDLDWDNDWVIPIYVNLNDVIGINNNTGISISENGRPFVSLPGASCSYDSFYKKYNCILSTLYQADRTQSISTFQLRVCDNLNNCTLGEIKTISFTSEVPTGSVSIVQATEASNQVNVTYSANDPTSGIKLITIENVTLNPSNVNREIIFSATGAWPTSLSGTKKGYTLTEKSGIVKMVITNQAGGSTTVYSNGVSANRIGFESTVIHKVINPKKYTLTEPFIPLRVNVREPQVDLPEALTGGKIGVTQHFYWDWSVTDLTGYYQFKIENSSGYVQYITRPLMLSDLIINGNTAVLVMETTVDKMAPISQELDITYVSLQVEMYVTINGVASKVPLYFPARNEHFKIAKITGGIDDAINFESRN